MKSKPAEYFKYGRLLKRSGDIKNLRDFMDHMHPRVEINWLGRYDSPDKKESFRRKSVLNKEEATEYLADEIHYILDNESWQSTDFGMRLRSRRRDRAMIVEYKAAKPGARSSGYFTVTTRFVQPEDLDKWMPGKTEVKVKSDQEF